MSRALEALFSTFWFSREPFSHLEIPNLLLAGGRVFRKMLCFLATKTLGSPVTKEMLSSGFPPAFITDVQ